MSANILEIHHLTKRFSDFTLDNLNLAVEPGTITGLVGANGAGKSTTIKLTSTCCAGMPAKSGFWPG